MAIEGRSNLGGNKTPFIDTAGLRETTDVVENIGTLNLIKK